MNAPEPIPSIGSAEVRALRAAFYDAFRYWEPRRILYNLVLTGVVIAWVAATWPHFRSAMAVYALPLLLILAALANACYCAAYFADIPIQCSAFRGSWRRKRWMLWLAGMAFATLLANYWIADEIYPFVR